MTNKETIEKYNGKKLGKAAYKNGTIYGVLELASIDDAYLILREIWNHEGYLTKDGFNFLKEYYGLEYMAQLLSDMGGFDESKDKQSILEWLIELKTETID